ncbi:MmgE/PrpD family protein [Piscinibacter sp. XHJ-5]|uniref:MmgE/PrpD family protein n=1 Tax=Piscinibacter sp. XHJ-5 TaxID=3037797 RepID=UPI002452AD09|nr:MmgE/PrpD family protein [Piscinibacter sp. XHJ-5]
MSATEVLARYAARSSDETLSGHVLHHAKRAVVDWYASLYPGLDAPAVQALESVLADDLDRGAARLALGRAATPRAAALIQGTAAHAAEVDDSFRDAMYHPGAATIAAALAAAQSVGANGLAFLRGVVVGYEVSTRIGVAMGRSHYKYWHNTGTMGTFGAAAAAGVLLGLDEASFAHALAMAGTFAAGLQQAFRSEAMAKPLHAGRAAESGLLAAQLAARGVRSSLDILDGEGGLGQAMSKEADWSRLGATLGEDFHITRLTFKNHIGCGHAFPAVDGALELRRQHGFTHRDIDRIHLRVYQAALDIAPHVSPRNADQARFSLHYMVASALVHGSVRLSAFSPERLNDPATRELMQRLTKALDPEIDAGFPGRRAARVDVTLRDGRCFTHFQPDRKGDPELPLSDAELGEKLIELASPVIGADPARALLDRLWALDQSKELP